MKNSEKIEAYYEKEQPFKPGVSILRELALKTELIEDYKWGCPVYTIDNKNVIGILAFKSYFGIWFFNGAFLSDPKKVLENVQEGKTKAMRHWKFTSVTDIDKATILAYLEEAVSNQKKGKVLIPEKKKTFIIPHQLQVAFDTIPKLKDSFKKLAPYKQRQYCEYIAEAKQEKTKQSRLEKCIPLILKEMGLHDKYR
ncbi:MAG: YdeI/OmpD-associated family protein [Arenibacter latericius]|nr:YdeI/OmpD-associated family protein [Arenibacter latericius]